MSLRPPQTSVVRSVACPEGFIIVDGVQYHACHFDSTPKRQRTSSPVLAGPIWDDSVPASSVQVSRVIVCAACGSHCTCNGGEDPRLFAGRLCQSSNLLQPRCFDVVDKSVFCQPVDASIDNLYAVEYFAESSDCCWQLDASRFVQPLSSQLFGIPDVRHVVDSLGRSWGSSFALHSNLILMEDLHPSTVFALDLVPLVELVCGFAPVAYHIFTDGSFMPAVDGEEQVADTPDRSG